MNQSNRGPSIYIQPDKADGTRGEFQRLEEPPCTAPWWGGILAMFLAIASGLTVCWLAVELARWLGPLLTAMQGGPR